MSQRWPSGHVHFKVLREKPSAGWVFDYITEAGRFSRLRCRCRCWPSQSRAAATSAVSYNNEPTGGTGDLPGAWDTNASPSGAFGHYNKFTFRDRKQDYWVYRGLHAGLPDLRAGTYVATNRTFINLSNATAVVDQPFSLTLHASRQDEFLAVESANAPTWLVGSGLTLSGTPTPNDISTNTLSLVVFDLYDGSRWTNTLILQTIASGSAITQGPLILSSTNSYSGTIINFSNRPPFLAQSPSTSNSFTMRFYYRLSRASPGRV